MNWLSKRQAASKISQNAYAGKVSAGYCSVLADGEVRDASLSAPGGYRWKPECGESVVVVRTGQEGEAARIIGQAFEDDPRIEPGEVLITSSGGAYIHLKNDGSAVINGYAFIKEGE